MQVTFLILIHCAVSFASTMSRLLFVVNRPQSIPSRTNSRFWGPETTPMVSLVPLYIPIFTHLAKRHYETRQLNRRIFEAVSTFNHKISGVGVEELSTVRLAWWVFVCFRYPSVWWTTSQFGSRPLPRFWSCSRNPWKATCQNPLMVDNAGVSNALQFGIEMDDFGHIA